jgi:2,4-dienoyl-CoA reductase-like NADH-dependent reductase (Old Yellow Enzyme family)
MAIDAGFDGIEVHGGNGYLPGQFLLSNVNQRTDEYGGSSEKRCRFVVELMEVLANAIGAENVAARLSPFGLFNEARGGERVETWSYLCRELKRRVSGMSYVSLIEPVCLFPFLLLAEVSCFSSLKWDGEADLPQSASNRF